MNGNKTIYIVDDNAQFRASAQWWLSAEGYDVVEFDEPERALSFLQGSPPRHPACMLLDVRMPGMSGLDLHDKLNARALDVPVIYMTGHGDVALAVKAMQKGAVHFLEKPFDETQLQSALERAFARGQTRSGEKEEASEPVLPGASPSAGQIEYQRRLASLSERQRLVFDCVVAGQLNKTIAWNTGISIKTVEYHRGFMMDKMGARTVLELIRMASTQSVGDALVADVR
jgi:FixJ family two-component response regulator